MIDQVLIYWAEKQYRVKCAKIIYTRNFPELGVDAFYCSGEETPAQDPIIVIWKGAENLEYLFLHELQHHIGGSLRRERVLT